MVKNKSNVVKRGLNSCRQRYAALQWSKCCATNWATSPSARFALVIEYVSSIHPWANSRCWISQSERALCFSYVIKFKRSILNFSIIYTKSKLEQLTGPPITCDSSLESLSAVVTFPENLPLYDAEKSVRSKGLNFVPTSKKLDEFSVKQDVEKFLRRVQLKPFFVIKRMILTSRTKTFSRTPREGQFASLDFFINKCRHDINKLNFNRNTKFSNLSSEERPALEDLWKRKDIIVKAADKGGALVVWRAEWPLPKRSFAATFWHLFLCLSR